LQIVGVDMLAGINENSKDLGSRVWNMMTSFKVNLETEQSTIKLDIHRLNSRLSKLQESLELLYTLKRKVEQTKKLLKLTTDIERRDCEVKEDLRRITTDFKHYVRQQWLFKLDQEANGEQQSLSKVPLEEYINQYKRKYDN
jgi:hypothetical protein